MKTEHSLIIINIAYLQAMEPLRAENKKLRDENGALIRVISKLSKWRWLHEFSIFVVVTFSVALLTVACCWPLFVWSVVVKCVTIWSAAINLASVVYRQLTAVVIGYFCSSETSVCSRIASSVLSWQCLLFKIWCTWRLYIHDIISVKYLKAKLTNYSYPTWYHD